VNHKLYIFFVLFYRQKAHIKANGRNNIQLQYSIIIKS